MLQHGDFVLIPETRRTISISGQFQNPGLVDYAPGKNTIFYIAKAGGYSWNADRDRARVIKGDTGIRLNLDSVQELQPGDEIWVPEKRDRNWWRGFRETMTLLGEIAIVVTAVRSLAP